MLQWEGPSPHAPAPACTSGCNVKLGTRGAGPCGMQTGGWGRGQCRASKGPIRLGQGSAGPPLAHAEGFWRPERPRPSKLHSTHDCSWLLEGGNEDLLRWGDGQEVTHIWGCTGAPFFLLPGLVQRADVEQGVRGVAAQDGEGIRLAQATW